MKTVEEIAKDVNSKESFTKFLDALIQDLKNNEHSWENKNLEEFLNAVQSWTEDMYGYYLNNNIPVPNNIAWRVFSDILIAAKNYE